MIYRYKTKKDCQRLNVFDLTQVVIYNKKTTVRMEAFKLLKKKVKDDFFILFILRDCKHDIVVKAWHFLIKNYPPDIDTLFHLLRYSVIEKIKENCNNYLLNRKEWVLNSLYDEEEKYFNDLLQKNKCKLKITVLKKESFVCQHKVPRIKNTITFNKE